MKVPISGQVTGKPEADNVMQVALSNHYGPGKWTERFEKEIARYMRARSAIFCNSGSSALLLAMSALKLPEGSHVLTCAVNFPTTVNVIIQCGCVPVFVDADPKTLNAINVELDINDNIDAMIFAHTLGNPLDLSHYAGYKLPIIEDCSDALGGKIDGRLVGQTGDMSTISFYPAHHITGGGGGVVLSNNSPQLDLIACRFMRWGRDCWCLPGKDNTCGKRFAGDFDHKYSYSEIGYNLQSTDFEAAVLVAQLERLDEFTRKRRINWHYLYEGLQDLPIEIVEASPGSVPSWFGFAFLTDKRNELQRYLDKHEIGNRPIMAGNLTRQKAYYGETYKVIGELTGANKIHEQGLWIGCFPGINKDMLDYVIEMFHAFYK